MNADTLTQDRLKELLHYDPETGVFTRRVVLNNKIKVGDIAGCLCNGYVKIRVEVRRYRAHRLAWLYMVGDWPKDQLDHINGKRDDNRWANIREATSSENMKNRKINTNNTSGIMGVCWNKRSGRWDAQIKLGGRTIHLGSFRDKTAAILARMEGEKKYAFHPNHGRRA